MIKPLTSLRFLAAILVFLFHIYGNPYYQFGYIFVPFFFILSGFILTINYHEKFNILNTNYILKYYFARIGRIYPVHLLTFVLVIPVVFAMKKYPVFDTWSHFLVKGISNLLLFQGFLPDEDVYFSFNGVSWTLSSEIFFYLFFPIILFVVLKVKKRLSFKVKAIMLVVFFIAAEKLWIHFGVSHNGTGWWWFFGINPIVNIPFFISGCLVAFLYLRQKKRVEESNNFILFSILEIVIIIILFGVNNYGVMNTENFNPYKYFILIFIAMIYIFSFSKGLFSKLISCKPFIYLGEISFSFYMIHQIIINYAFFVFYQQHSTYIYITIFIISLVLSMFLYHFVENPFRKIIRYGVYDYVQRK